METKDMLCEHIYNVRAKISEKQEEIIMQTIQEIGGETFYEITIDRDKVIEALTMYKNKADYAEVKHGEWIEITDNVYFCSKCNRTICFGGKSKDFFPYCHCGAKMDGGKET